MLTRRKFLMATGATLWATPLAAATGDILQIEGPAFGAGWRIRLADGADPGAIIAAVTGIVSLIDQRMSPYLATSEISRFNRLQSLDRVALSPDTSAVLVESQRMAALTNGAFDPTLGGIVGRYGFGPLKGQPAGKFSDTSIDSGGARKGHPHQTFDLCGIAKGYALDLIVARLKEMGHSDVFVELGGEVLATGQHPKGRPWRAGIERPLPGPSALQHQVIVGGEALATSGDRINSFAYAGHGYSHIIDPATRQPAVGTLASVSVFAPRACTADALATALFAMGAEAGAEFAQRQHLPALFLSRDEAGLREVMTGDFSTRIQG